jgi:hypothetical protein
MIDQDASMEVKIDNFIVFKRGCILMGKALFTRR